MLTAAIVCGAGVSSTFLARAVRTLAIDRGLEWRVEPLAEDQLLHRIDELSIVLVGHHLADRFAALQAALAAIGVPAALLDASDHASAAEQGVGLLHSLDLAAQANPTMPVDHDAHAVSEGRPHG